MLANFLNKSKPINFISLLVFFALCFITSVTIYFFKNSFSVSVLFEKMGVLLLFIITFFIYNFITSKNNLTYDNSFGIYFFSILACIFSSEVHFKTLIFVIIYLLFLRKIYSLQSSKKVLKKLFDAGFWLGILCLFEPKYVLFFLLMYLSAYWHQKITIHTVFTPLIGFITPFFVYFSYLFWIDNQAVFYEIFSKEFTYKMSFYTDEKEKFFILFLLITTFFAALIKSKKALLINNTFKKSWSLLLINFLLVLGLFFFKDTTKTTELIFLCVPISLILTNGLEMIQKRIFVNIALYLFLLGCLTYFFIL